ncbi:hypothetical protein OV208_16990 [Corallococcus sp. bb12-1]|uniref:papain-like cysteine protease family protein n=1 Tax=Corallococcus sp. bb12-1 TaxID=2996784 RepID=UPI0022720FE5|nr:papain-like cysteine protease family protein [Corallococcus sp. bb12-1]MCY1043019.1 hypothetical protein [Corallococcus sp. bb12-1]
MTISRVSNPRTVLPPETQRVPEVQGQGVTQARPEAEPVQEVAKTQAAEPLKDSYEEDPVSAAEWSARAAASGVQPREPAVVGVSEMEAAPSITGAKGWTQPTPVIPQTDPTNCGPATAAMLVRAAGGGQGQTDAELVKGLESKYANSQGTTPDQMGDMLAGQGFEVTRGASNFDRDALNTALAQGKKAVALVDSNLIQSGAEGGKAGGSAHWVEIDGKDAQGNYRINDSASGKSYSAGLQQLTDAMNTGWDSFNGGGMLIVQPKGGDTAALTHENENHSGTLGKTPGIGSKASAAGTRESGS